MAAVSAWAKPGAWALDAEENDKVDGNVAGKPIADVADVAADFPSLAAAVATKPSRKKKPQTVSLAEFNAGKSIAASKYEEPVVLPTGPRRRTAEELERSRSGFGYSSYGERRRGFGDEGGNPNPRGSARGSDDSRRDHAPSRADEVDDWGSGKRSMVPERRRERGVGGLFDSQSRADESDNWTSNKSVVVPRNGFDGIRERRGGFDFHKEGSNGSGADSEMWGRKRETTNGGSGDSDNWGRRREGVGEPDSWMKKEETVGGASRPRLVLQPRSLPLSNVQEEKVVVKEDVIAKDVKSVNSNPFGAARPREEVLAEKGQNWKEIDEKLEAMKIREAPTAGKKNFINGTGRSFEDRTAMAWRKPNTSEVSLLGEYKVEETAAEN